MSDLGDQLRRWANQAEPVTAEDARQRAVAAGRGSAPRRRAWLAVAAVALLVIGIGAFAATRADHDGGDDVRTGPSPTPTSTTEPTPSSTTATTTVAGAPAVFVAHDASHRLVVVDALTGQTTRVLDTFDDPDATVPEGEPAGMGRYLGRFSVTPDGQTVYFETCCEPAVGEIFRVPIEGGEPERVSYGTDPAVSPDGTRLAVVDQRGIKVIDLASGEESSYPIADNVPFVALAHPAWSPDGTMLALERYDGSLDAGRIVLVTFDGAEDVVNAAATITEADDDGTPTLPVFDAGRLLVVHQRTEDMVPIGPARVELFGGSGLLTGIDLQMLLPLPQPVLAQSSSTRTGHLIRLFTDGRVELTKPDGTTTMLDTDLRDVAW